MMAEEEDDDDEFHDSLDRALSSACSSTSTSASASSSEDDSADKRGPPRRGSNLLRGVSARFQNMYDVWASPPASVDERRRHLLKMLGLRGDSSLSRRSPSPPRDSGSNDLPLSPDENGVAANSEVVDGDRYCRIRNLDSGEEFVVKELTEDGMWDKLREVGTGRQLTMEEFQASVVGQSPIVQELMRRDGSTGQKEEEEGGEGEEEGVAVESRDACVARWRKKGSWFRSIGNVVAAIRTERRSSDERDTSSEKGGRRSSSATDDGQEVQHGGERVRVRQYGKSWRELSGLYVNQEIRGHSGSIWSIRFSADGRYLASAGEDCVIHVRQVVEWERKRDPAAEKGAEENRNRGGTSLPAAPAAASNASPEPTANFERESSEKRRRTKVSASRKSLTLDHVVFMDYVVGLSERPVCSFHGHQKDVLDLSWSKSAPARLTKSCQNSDLLALPDLQFPPFFCLFAAWSLELLTRVSPLANNCRLQMQLLSSSMDKTVRLWDMSDNSCLKIFSHSDYVTCIQFNPVDDNYFISGSLDSKIRMWSIEDRQVVDWIDLREMATAACYTPDGQGALIGSHKGTCNFFKVSGSNRFQQRTEINLQNKKKSNSKKITGFQFVPGSSSEVLITSADSRIRIVDNIDLVHKFKGFRNTTSQISASITADGNHVICASEDSHVYIWRYETDSQTGRNKVAVSTSQCYEHFHCEGVSVAAAWPGTNTHRITRGGFRNWNEVDALSFPSPNTPTELTNRQLKSPFPVGNHSGTWMPSPTNSDRDDSEHISARWSDDRPMPSPTVDKQSPRNSGELNSGEQLHHRSAWGMVIVTAGRGGELKVFQNFGYPIRV